MTLAAIPSPPSPTLNIGGLMIHYIALFVTLGVLVAALLTARRWQRRGGRPGRVGDVGRRGAAGRHRRRPPVPRGHRGGDGAGAAGRSALRAVAYAPAGAGTDIHLGYVRAAAAGHPGAWALRLVVYPRGADDNAGTTVTTWRARPGDNRTMRPTHRSHRT